MTGRHRLSIGGRALAMAVMAASLLLAAPGPPAHAATGFSYWFTWYDNASPGMSIDNIHVVNPSPTATATVTITLAGAATLGGTIAPHGERYWAWPAGTTIGGPVLVNGDIPLVVSQRVTYGDSFNEIAAQPDTAAKRSFWFPWYDRASPGVLNDNIHVLNPGDVDANVAATIGTGGYTYSILVRAHSATYHSFPSGVLGGPVHITSDQNVLVSQRVQWFQSFNEMPGLPDAAAAPFQVINWYDQASPGFNADDIHILNPGTTDGSVTIRFPGHADTTLSVPQRVDVHLSYPQAIGGPVTFTSTVPVFVTQRVDYWHSFKEYAALTPASATREAWFNWYDNASPCFVQNNIHLYTTGHATGTIQLGQPAASMPFDFSGEGFFSFPLGTIGGPVHVTVTSGDPVYPESRTVRCPPPPPPAPPPPVPLPARLRMPALGFGYCWEASAAIEQVGPDANGNMGVPANSCDVAWFNAMPRPGDSGDAVITGHVNWYDSSCAAFCYLSDVNVRVGMDLYVDRVDGSTVHFVVDNYNYYDASAPPSWLYVTTGSPQLTLITCAGELLGGHYTQRFVVHSHQV